MPFFFFFFLWKGITKPQYKHFLNWKTRYCLHSSIPSWRDLGLFHEQIETEKLINLTRFIFQVTQMQQHDISRKRWAMANLGYILYITGSCCCLNKVRLSPSTDMAAFLLCPWKLRIRPACKWVNKLNRTCFFVWWKVNSRNSVCRKGNWEWLYVESFIFLSFF